MPTAARYAREKQRLAAEGTTAYKRRVEAARRTYGPKLSARTATGHPKAGEASLRERRLRRGIQRRMGVEPGTFCAVCGAKIEPERPNSYSCRECTREQVRLFRASNQAREWASFRGLRRLAENRGWVIYRQAKARAEGVEVRPPTGIVLEEAS